MALWRSVHARGVTKRVAARCCEKRKPLDRQAADGAAHRSVLGVGRQCVLEALHGHVVEQAGIHNLGAETVLLEQLQGTEGWAGMAAAHDQS